MKNEELINALRWCQKRGCSKCVALLDNGSCKYGGAIKIFDAAADALEAAEKRIAELEAQLPKHGEWIAGKEIAREMLCDKTTHIFYENYKCSVCGLILDKLLFNVDGTPFYKYCPSCGAKMDGKEMHNDG